MKRLKNIEGKDEERLKAIKDQGEKQLQILTKKTEKVMDFKNISFKDKLNPESKNGYNAYNELRNEVKGLIIQNLPPLSALAQVI